ncbi:Outer membrane porin protein precursor [Pigmentiphaga humi]|uniref:Outer membrane porin protein n=1 Tax=Pigmentiphaga humi TaxID=2478468 RepID=A0A3P4AZH6_9BURK|nr:porin [Pigmentiphaga humi]VCU69447.1 Outer membrane porin protein precursor [Pigmentiphaga humi]
MKKTLIAAALLTGFAGAAHAQSNVTLYGIVDMGYVYDKSDGSSGTSKLDSGALGSSRFGLRGTEDLGNGLKANFQLENGFKADTGDMGTANTLFDRASWVGVSGSFGEVRLGRQDSLGFNWFRGAVNPFGNSYLQGQSATIFNVRGPADRFSNSAFYYSPKFSGFQGGVGYSFNTSAGETTGNDGDNSAYSLGLRYNAGPLLAVLTYEQQNGADNTPAQADIKNLQLGAVYDFGMVKLHAGYGQIRNANYAQNAKKQNAYLIGVSVPFGASTVLATYQRVDNANLNAGKADKDIGGFSVAYNYALSKRTTLYALFNQYSDIVTRVDNGQLGDRRQFAVGVQHKF